MSAPVSEMKGSEILEAINDAGLKKRQQAGIEPQTSQDVSVNAGSEAYAKGGLISGDDEREQERAARSRVDASEVAAYSAERKYRETSTDLVSGRDGMSVYTVPAMGKGDRPNATGRLEDLERRKRHEAKYARGGRVTRYASMGI